MNPLLTPTNSLSGESGDPGLGTGEAESSAERLTEADSRLTEAS